MILAVDVGNSNIVICGVEGDDICFEARLQTDSRKTADEYAIDMKTLLEVHNMESSTVEGAIISSVVPQVQESLQSALNTLLGKEPLVVGQNVITGMEIQIDDPAEVGADLIVGCAAAQREYKLPLIVIDMGTATTMFALDQTGAFVGGSIAPGVGISLEALTGRTALLPEMDLDKAAKAIGKNTIDCMKSGILMGNACMLDGMVQRMEEELGSKATVVITGGIAGLVLPMCRTPMIYDKDLLIKGLAALYRENTGR